MIAELTLPETTPTDAEIRIARDSSHRLSKLLEPGKHTSCTISVDGEGTVEIPAAAAELLLRLLTEMAQGNAVTLIPIHAELTTQRVADLLGVSRPFVVKEIEEGRLPARKVGTHRRVLFKDLVVYRRRMDADRQRALDELAALDQKLRLE